MKDTRIYAQNESNGVFKQDLYPSQGTHTTLPFTSRFMLAMKHLQPLVAYRSQVYAYDVACLAH